MKHFINKNKDSTGKTFDFLPADLAILGLFLSIAYTAGVEESLLSPSCAAFCMETKEGQDEDMLGTSPSLFICYFLPPFFLNFDLLSEQIDLFLARSTNWLFPE